MWTEARTRWQGAEEKRAEEEKRADTQVCPYRDIHLMGLRGLWTTIETRLFPRSRTTAERKRNI